MKPIIRVERVGFNYGLRNVSSESCLLDNLTFQVLPGEILGIIGPNGCGKSTLINLLSKVLTPHAGEIFIHAQALAKMKQQDVARAIAVLPQDISVSFHYSVEEMVLMGRAPYRNRLGWETNADYEVAEEVLDLTCMRDFAERWFLELSGGERCRALLARALAQRPEILLLDEPTANLDLQYQTQILDMIAGFARKHGSTVCIVTHDLNLVGEYCDRVAVLKDGRVYREGSPAEIIQAKTIADVYNTQVHVGTNPHSGAPHVFLKSDRAEQTLRSGD
ncbi:MAG: hypothetical protein CMH81_01380 [Nitrospiraceae bacterium]|nr:hypothetical protein [Nitrospiraceae bacterium]